MEIIHFGPEQKTKIEEPLDTWLTSGLRDFGVPEAAGSSARVFKLNYAPLSGEYSNFPAIKVMRPDKIKYALPLFESEARILHALHDVPGVTPLLGTGFLQVSDGQWPDEIAPLSTSLAVKASGAALAGEADLFALDEINSFLSQLQDRVTNGWLAFFVLPRRWEDNLYLRCDAGYTRGEYHRSFSVKEALQVALQICDILAAAHDQGIVYLDHKILHFYWNQPRKQVYVLDWNIGRIISNGNSQEIYAFDVLQFSARALHHLMTGRQASGSVRVGPNRPEDIQNAPEKYEPIWTYDDQKRLLPDEMDFLSEAIQGGITTAADLGQRLTALYQQRQSQA